ncbi:MAG: formate dehydrogenase accessory sulfurtransferase FdhD [Clostridia bacterium]|nr:formate dehydrogenase accessory sulfurtransferase FdhD [Clostridia bacterium]
MKGIMDEQLLFWQLNGRRQAPLDCSPGEDENLLTGLLLTGMAVPDPGKIRSIVRNGDTWEVRTDGRDELPDLARRLGMIPSRAVCSPATEEAAYLAGLIRECGKGDGLHTALLLCGGTVFRGRDIARHSALDRAVGKAARAGARPEGAVLAISGRLSLEMLAKAAAVGVGTVLTGKQAGRMAMEYADKWGVLLADPCTWIKE